MFQFRIFLNGIWFFRHPIFILFEILRLFFLCVVSLLCSKLASFVTCKFVDSFSSGSEIMPVWPEHIHVMCKFNILFYLHVNISSWFFSLYDTLRFIFLGLSKFHLIE